MTEERRSINPETIHNPFGNYSHGIFNPKSGLLVTSGQLGIYKNGKIPKSLLEQTNLCFENIQAILKDVELDLTHVLRVSAFLTKRDHFSEYMGVRDSFFADIPIKPASTLLIVSGFTKPEFLVEVEVIAQKLT